MPDFHIFPELGRLETTVGLYLCAEGRADQPPGDRSYDVGGRAVVIAPHLAITAKHTLRFLREKFGIDEGKSEAFFLLSAIMMFPNGGPGAEIRVLKTTECQFTDIAFLQLGKIPEGVGFDGWNLPEIELRPPAVGTTLTAFGYTRGDVTSVDHDIQRVSVYREFARASGVVEDVFEEQRDRTMINFPSAQVGAKFVGGMSGGPVFNEAGLLCGLVTTGMATEDEPPISYVALIWPALGTLIDFGVAGATELLSFHELGKRGVVAMRHLADFSVVADVDDDRITVSRAMPSAWVMPQRFRLVGAWIGFIFEWEDAWDPRK